MYRHGSVGTPTRQGKRKVRSPEWDQAIKEARQKIRDLEYSIRTFQEFRDSGEPWPSGKHRKRQ
jgi:hypothetical protein